MTFDLLVNISVCGGATIAALVAVAKLSQSSKAPQLDAIPTVGSSSWLGSWWTGFKFMTNGFAFIQEGYEKYKSAPFKVAQLTRWVVILADRRHVEEIARAPEDVLSFHESVKGLEHVIGPQLLANHYHVPIVRLRLTRNIGLLYPEISDEIATAFDDVLNLKGNDWKSIPAFSSVQTVVCRTSNRVFVGLSLCRDPDWIDLATRFTFDVVKGVAIVGWFPDTLKQMATRLFTNVHESKQRARKLLGPVIEERQRYLNDCGNEWADKPNDLLSWLMEEADSSESTIDSLTVRILALNFAAIVTTTTTFTHALLYLAANPQYIQPLREEVEATVQKDGWSKAAVGKMRKVDSFIKECQRLEGISCWGVVRIAMTDFTFSDGIFVPKGTTLALASRPIHHDEKFYENPHVFEPFRFSDLRENDGESVKHHFASTTAKYLLFGHGRNACPGRFFAASEMKSMLAHIVMTYDVKLAHGVTRPPSLHVGSAVFPNPNATVMFRRRGG